MKLVIRLSFISAFILNSLATILADGYPLKITNPFYADFNFYANQIFWLALVFTIMGGVLRSTKSKVN